MLLDIAGAVTAVAIALLVLAYATRMRERTGVRAALQAASNVLPTTLRESVNPTQNRSFAERILLPLIDKAGKNFVRLTPSSYVDRARQRLIFAGKPQPQELDRFIAGRIVSVVLVPVVLLFALVLPVSKHTAILLVLVFSILLVLGPEAMLNRRAAERQEQIRRQLADMMDLLTISVEAGLGFEQALSRTVTAMEGPLSEEFTRMLGETRVGASRREAFERVSERTDVAELRSFLAALRQAETFGISIVHILRSQAEEMRIARHQRAQEKAQKAPVKMLFPLVFCIMPALFVVVVGPAAIEIYRTVIK